MLLYACFSNVDLDALRIWITLRMSDMNGNPQRAFVDLQISVTIIVIRIAYVIMFLNYESVY